MVDQFQLGVPKTYQPKQLFLIHLFKGTIIGFGCLWLEVKLNA
jgi:hypothetical protein